MEFGSIRTVSVKEIWPGEATDFTPWLSRNLDAVSEKLGMELALEGVESSAGDFSADIVARDLSTNRLVVIENQFGSTDHRHLGQIITYASVLGAQAVIWIAETIRSEHKAAINFLNQNLKESLQLYAIEVSLIRIDDSRPAYSFSVVCMPAEVPVPLKAQEASELRQKYRVYFQALIDELRNRHQFTNARVGQPQNWYTFSSENSRIFTYSTSFAQRGRVRAEVYIDCGDKARNEALFDVLLASRADIDAAMGAELHWERLDNRRACRIALYRDGDIDAPSEILDEIKRWAIASLLKFKAVFPERILQAHLQANRT
jgi:hypothetical protein